jgi:hypothetical protein
VVLIGHACALRSTATEVTVGLRVGSVQKIVTVIGDRYWTRERNAIVMSSPQPFERIPLVYERAFGGWDRQDADHHACETRNPVGRGFRARWNDSEATVPVPNVEDPQQRIRSFGDRPAPAGFGFLAPHWMPRASYAGTYDAAWIENRRPLLPVDFDRRFFNSASAGLVARRYFDGTELVQVANAGIAGQLAFTLPGVPAPRVEVTLRRSGDRVLETKLDTVIINADERVVILIWRAHVRVSDVPRDVEAIAVQ